jgi:hypothetical protein
MANNLAKKAGEEIARGVSRVLAENLPIYRYIESSLSLGAERAVEKGIAKGKVIAVASLGRSGYPNIKLDDGTMVKEEEMAELAQTLNRLF